MKSNQVLCRWFVIVNGNVVAADHLNVNKVAANGADHLFNVVGRHHHGSEGAFGGGVVNQILCSDATCEAGKNHHQACKEGAWPCSAHGLRFSIRYLTETNN